MQHCILLVKDGQSWATTTRCGYCGPQDEIVDFPQAYEVIVTTNPDACPKCLRKLDQEMAEILPLLEKLEAVAARIDAEVAQAKQAITDPATPEELRGELVAALKEMGRL